MYFSPEHYSEYIYLRVDIGILSSLCEYVLFISESGLDFLVNCHREFLMDGSGSVYCFCSRSTWVYVCAIPTRIT